MPKFQTLFGKKSRKGKNNLPSKERSTRDEETSTTMHSLGQPLEHVDELQGPPDHTQMPDVARARLNESAKMLKELVISEWPDDGGSELKAIEASADINTLADQVGLAIETMMRQRNIDRSNEPAVQKVIKGWVTKVLPFVTDVLSDAKVSLGFRCVI
jgi:hypothetical protein